YTPAGHPIIDYDAVYPTGHKFAGLPILRMLDANNEIVHADLTAIITGPNLGEFPPGTYPDVEGLRNRTKPVREFTIIFHDEIGIVQAFPIFEDPQFEFTLHSGRDAFAINYGTGGIGAEILANRFGVGPMGNCNECKYEEFFLSSWTVGDPAMVVDVAANATDGSGELIPGPKATKALYPDDPSNVYHSYMNDHVKIRNLHAGPKEHHIFHLHAHQWLHTPDGDNSSYLDSQAIGPGSGFTYETTYDGSGNRNKTPGDAIFHCHFYPHFAMGMWGLWRAPDVYEMGTEPGPDGQPAPGSRPLPDGAAPRGTPCPRPRPAPAAGRRDRGGHADPRARADADVRARADAGHGRQPGLSVLHPGHRGAPSAQAAARDGGGRRAAAPRGRGGARRVPRAEHAGLQQGEHRAGRAGTSGDRHVGRAGRDGVPREAQPSDLRDRSGDLHADAGHVHHERAAGGRGRAVRRPVRRRLRRADRQHAGLQGGDVPDRREVQQGGLAPQAAPHGRPV